MTRRRLTTEPVRPTFPVVPMYVVAVLFLGYSVFLIGYGDRNEGAIDIWSPGVNDRERPLTFTVTVAAGPKGTIGALTIHTHYGPRRDGDDWDRRAEPIGAGLNRYRAELGARRAGLRGRPARLVLQLGPGFDHQGYVQLLDIAMQAGFTEVEACPSDPDKQ